MKRRAFIAASAAAAFHAAGGPVGFRLPGSGLPTPPVSDLSVWFDAARIAGLSDGAAVSRWEDLTGRGRHAAQATGTKQPLFKVNQQNGLPGVLADGVDDFLQTAAFVRAQPHAVWFCMKLTDTTPGINTEFLDGRAVNTARIFSMIGTYPHLTLYSGGYFSNDRDAGNTVVGYALFEGASSSLVVNGVTVGGTLGTSSASGLSILGMTGVSTPGYMFEVFCKDGNITSDRDAGIDYLTNKWQP